MILGLSSGISSPPFPSQFPRVPMEEQRAVRPRAHTHPSQCCWPLPHYTPRFRLGLFGSHRIGLDVFIFFPRAACLKGTTSNSAPWPGFLIKRR
ncbi:hypothetical protein RRG08_057027 [Elysia crispata]|uniref:Uncharacterized protein n=1 Tax=Elysia crispata TaxID=231223 RepID=A0AAE1DAJ5_9GAST|nr:hypothetical protein RRG08_057027 [Elysia crispata]